MTPIEIFMTQFLLLPIGVCFTRWAFSFSWVSAFLLCAAVSWVFINLSLWLDPADNGFANVVNLFLGWVYLLPVMGLSSLLFLIAGKKMNPEKRATVGRLGIKVIITIFAISLVWNLVGWMPESRAIKEAANRLSEHSYSPTGDPQARLEAGKWIVYYPESEFKEIGLTRNGKVSWIGGF